MVEVLRAGQEPLALVVSGPGRCDLAVVDTVAWICLAARRTGARSRVRTTSADVVELLGLVGLGEHCEVLLGPPGDPV